MTIYDAYLIKGHLLDKSCPLAILEAIDSVIDSLKRPVPEPETTDTTLQTITNGRPKLSQPRHELPPRGFQRSCASRADSNCARTPVSLSRGAFTVRSLAAAQEETPVVSGSQSRRRGTHARSASGRFDEEERAAVIGGSPSPAFEVRQGKRKWKSPTWSQEQKDLLMELAAKDGVTPEVARKVRKHITECHRMYKLLSGYAALGKPKIVVENGVRVTKCPPAYACGVWPDRNVGYSKKH
jgi:hypothetical protein